MTKAMKKKKNNIVVKRQKMIPRENKVTFAGAQRLMSEPGTPKERNERRLIVLVAKALNINPFGVNILGNLPYTNNLGRKDKLAQYSETARFEYRWVKRSETDEDKAICECRILETNMPLCGWVVGECSPKTIKMGPLQGYQNHMAQTRAENRAFEAAFGNRMRLELFENVQRLLAVGATGEGDAAKALHAGVTSAEEAVDMHPHAPVPVEKKTRMDENDMQKVRMIIKSTNSIDALMQIETKVKDSSIYTAEQKKDVIKLVGARYDEIDA